MTAPPLSFEALEARIGFCFNNKALLKQALTHRSITRTHPKLKHNERLEFFGDSVLKFIMSEHLFLSHPKASEGDLSKKRSQLISDQFMAEMARQIELGRYLILSYGEKKSGGTTRLSILANSMEALLGACYLDQGMDAVKTMFFNLFNELKDRLDDLTSADFKSKIQEFCQKKGFALPVYTLTKTEGPDHDRTFFIDASLTIDPITYVTKGHSKTKKDAEQQAAQHLIATLPYPIT